jgi:hypothetical protein
MTVFKWNLIPGRALIAAASLFDGQQGAGLARFLNNASTEYTQTRRLRLGLKKPRANPSDDAAYGFRFVPMLQDGHTIFGRVGLGANLGGLVLAPARVFGE